MIIGYSPFDCPHPSPHYPFNTIFEYYTNLITAKDLSQVDAVLLWGGTDIYTGFYNEDPIKYPRSGPAHPTDRDLFEWELLKLAKKQKKPIIGVCRGAQLMCAFAGGHLIQHVEGHRTSHGLSTYDGKSLSVSSEHHQMMYPYNLEPEEYTLLAWAPTHLSSKYLPEGKLYTGNMDKRLFKEPEVVYFPKIKGMAIQCHPEWHGVDHREFNAWLFKQIDKYLFNKS